MNSPYLSQIQKPNINHFGEQHLSMMNETRRFYHNSSPFQNHPVMSQMIESVNHQNNLLVLRQQQRLNYAQQLSNYCQKSSQICNNNNNNDNINQTYQFSSPPVNNTHNLGKEFIFIIKLNYF